MCVCFHGEVEHYRIIYKDNKVTIDEEEFFENLTKLVEVCFSFEISDRDIVKKCKMPLRRDSLGRACGKYL